MMALSFVGSGLLVISRFLVNLLLRRGGVQVEDRSVFIQADRLTGQVLFARLMSLLGPCWLGIVESRLGESHPLENDFGISNKTNQTFCYQYQPTISPTQMPHAPIIPCNRLNKKLPTQHRRTCHPTLRLLTA